MHRLTPGSGLSRDARLYRKGEGKEAKLCYMGHALMESRNGLVVEAYLTHADGHGERNAALAMIEPRADSVKPVPVEDRRVGGRNESGAWRAPNRCETARPTRRLVHPQL
jgi:hypothetical protein